MTTGIDQNQDVLTRFISQAAAQGGRLSSGSSSSSSGSSGSSGGWFRAVAEAWGKQLDGQAARIESLSDQIGSGGDNPATMVNLTAESLRMGFLSQNASTSITSIAEGLSTTARKQ